MTSEEIAEEIDAKLWSTADVLCEEGSVTRVFQTTYNTLRRHRGNAVLPSRVLMEHFGSWLQARMELEARQEEILSRQAASKRRRKRMNQQSHRQAGQQGNRQGGH